MKNNFCCPSEYQHTAGNLPHRDEHQEGDAWVRGSYASARDILQAERSLLLSVLVFLLFLWLVLVNRAPSCYFVLSYVVIGHFIGAFYLCVKTSIGAKSLIRNWICSHYRFIFMQIKRHLRMKSFERSLVLKQRQRELGNGLNLDRIQSYFLESFKKLGYNSCFQSLRVRCHDFNDAFQ